MNNELQTLLCPGEPIPWTVNGFALHTTLHTSVGNVVRISRITDGRKGTIYIKSGDYEIAFDALGDRRGGGDYCSEHLRPITEEEAKSVCAKNRANNTRRALAEFDWKALSDEQVGVVRELFTKTFKVDPLLQWATSHR